MMKARNFGTPEESKESTAEASDESDCKTLLSLADNAHVEVGREY